MAIENLDPRKKWADRLRIMKDNRATDSDTMSDGEMYLLDQMINNTAEMVRDFSPIDLYKENEQLKAKVKELEDEVQGLYEERAGEDI